ncbi:uncharacterized protein LOC141617016 [Silene latifolia]|uniref:uncharacterized protein LOC141617016 n=1 Tax=Silene latifolia TaxID=37657 RepID=UPI003D7720F3
MEEDGNEIAKIRAEVASILRRAGIEYAEEEVSTEESPVTEHEDTGVVPTPEENRIVEEKLSPIAEDAELEIPKVNILKLTSDDVQEEIDYWSLAIYGYVMGANPPWAAMEGYLRREWRDYEITKIAFLPNGLFVVRFATIEHHNLVLKKGMFLFDGKPVIIRPWEPNTKITKVSVKTVPIWIKLVGLDLKFWGAKCLEKLASIVGKFIRIDDLTIERTLLGFARVMVEVTIDQQFPDKIKFEDELGQEVTVLVEYDWLPITCMKCKGIGHSAAQCRKGNGWMRRPIQPVRQQHPKQVWKRRETVESTLNPADYPQLVKSPGIIPTVVPTQEAVHKDSGQGSNTGVNTPAVTPLTTTTGAIFTPARILTRMTRYESRIPGRTGGFVANFNTELAKSGEMVDKGGGGEALASHGVKPGSLNKVVDNLCVGWSYITNHLHHEGGRIWVLWKDQKYVVNIVDMEAQFIHLKVKELVTANEFFVTYVYGFNKIEERVPLWDALVRIAVVEPWIVLGDFNNVMYLDEKIGLPVKDAEVLPFQNTVELCDLQDIKCTGSFFTWNNKQPSATRVFSRIDRVLVNKGWCDKWPDYFAYYAPEGDYDHCPCFITDGDTHMSRKKPFKFYNMWTGVNEFAEILKNGWNRRIQGTPMYIVVRKLKLLKPDFKTLNKDLFSDVEKNAEIAMGLLLDIQKQLQLDPTNRTLMDTEYLTRASYQMLAKAKEEFLKQKAKIDWAKEGDINSAMFHRVINQRQMNNKVLQIADSTGLVCKEPEKIMQAFVDYYVDLLGTKATSTGFSHSIMQNGARVQEEDWEDILKKPTVEEIKNIVFSIPDDKSPGPDGYSSCFFKAGWEIIKGELCTAVQDFFQNEQLLKQVNNTNLILIPKVKNPTSVKEFRPLACCNTIYKIISKLLFARLAPILPKIISPNQAAFIKGRSIMGNILISQDLVRLYNRKSVSPRCMLKVDLRKAYDSIEWNFIHQRPQADPSNASGLQISNEKSDIIFNGIPTDVERDILMNSGFKKVSLPFKYLGVNISHKRLSKVDCNSLVEKMVTRIRGWNKRRISYSGRLTLVKFVLATLHNYWAQIFILPAGVMDKIQALCRNFLWEGTDDYSKAPLVSWKTVCRSKETGGLGVFDSKIWNIAAMGKLVWWIVSKKDHLWILWIDKIYIKSKHWKDYSPSNSSSWAWRKVCEVKTRLRDAFVDDKWLGKDGEYSIKDGYNWLIQEQNSRVSWYHVVWNRFNISSHCFNSWLIHQNRLLTLDRLTKMGIANQGTCFMCDVYQEDHDHLFAKCIYSRHCYGRLFDWLQIRMPGNLSPGGMLKLRNYSGFIRKLLSALMVATQYQIWYARNTSRVNQYVIHPGEIIRTVRQGCHLKLISCTKEGIKQEDIIWCRQRGLL